MRREPAPHARPGGDEPQLAAHRGRAPRSPAGRAVDHAKQRPDRLTGRGARGRRGGGDHRGGNGDGPYRAGNTAAWPAPEGQTAAKVPAGPPDATIQILSAHKLVLWSKDARGTTAWRYWYYHPRCGRAYHVRYHGGGTPAYTARVRVGPAG
jgi:hypothetical protein